MMHGIYSEREPRKDLWFKGALLRQHPIDPDKFIAQFDPLHLREAHGWHEFPKKDFVNIEGQELPINPNKKEKRNGRS